VKMENFPDLKIISDVLYSPRVFQIIQNKTEIKDRSIFTNVKKFFFHMCSQSFNYERIFPFPDFDSGHPFETEDKNIFQNRRE